MRTTFLVVFFSIVLSAPAFAVVYIGGNYGLSAYSAQPLEKYRIHPKGTSYGGFLGVGKDFVGFEGFYQSFPTKGEIKHDGASHDITTNATAIGGALRFGFQSFYLRLGVANFDLRQSLSISDEASREAADKIYEIKEKARKNGVLFGGGIHGKLSENFRYIVDYSRYQITGVGEYDTISIGLSFNLPERFLALGKF